jgi:glutathionyl-hydroquinone reductase
MASGMMVAGKWITDRNEQNQSGEFHEIPTTFRHYITADGSSGFKAEAGRYHLYVALILTNYTLALATPWGSIAIAKPAAKGRSLW